MLTLLATAAQTSGSSGFAGLLYDSVFGHYLLDWGAAAAGLVSVWRLGSKHKDGFVWGMVSCAFWVAFNTLVVSLPGVVFNLIWIAFNVRGLVKWAREHREAAASAPAGNG